ncbi:hypothetical protein SCUCBS95973_007424 [Sporothrix curviconia]|uniref:Uncharacterized protein n=1 Tax=Sporothrix curviconia TaxID=1260050 RepID=A0ABP0CEF6_9PEZI
MAKVVLITGANTGIGYETVKALLQNDKKTPYRIFLGCRSLAKGEAARKQALEDVPATQSTIDVFQVDVASDESIAAAFTAVSKATDHIDALVNNAGHALDTAYTKGELTLRECWNQNFDVNVSGTDVMTHTFAPLLIKSKDARLLFITSGLSSIVDFADNYYVGPAPSETGWPKTFVGRPTTYRATKVALNMMMLNWHYLLKPDGVKTFSISPGMLATNLGGLKDFLVAHGAGHPSLGGQLIQKVVAGERDSDAGFVVTAAGRQNF